MIKYGTFLQARGYDQTVLIFKGLISVNLQNLNAN